MSHVLDPCPTFKLFTRPTVYFYVFLSSHLITAFTEMFLGVGWHMASSSGVIVCPWWQRRRIISNSSDQHMQAKGDLCDLRLSQLYFWKCESSGMWCSVIRYVGLDVSRTLQTSIVQAILALCHGVTSQRNCFFKHYLVMFMWYKVLSDFSLPW
jgi:hypothetical protein